MVKIGLKRINPNKGKQPTFIETMNGCIECNSHARNADGYVRIYAGKGIYPRCQFVHRLVWKQVNGDIPDGYEIDHLCNNRGCCNIMHLQCIPVKDHRVKTNIERYKHRIEQIRTLLQEGLSGVEIAKQLHISPHTVYRHKKEFKNG